MNIWAGLVGILHGCLLIVEPSSYWVRTFSTSYPLNVLEGVLVIVLAMGILLKIRASAILLFFYILVAKILLVIVLRRYYALLPGLFWIVNYYCGILGTFSLRK